MTVEQGKCKHCGKVYGIEPYAGQYIVKCTNPKCKSQNK